MTRHEVAGGFRPVPGTADAAGGVGEPATVRRLGEFETIARITAELGHPPADRVPLGPGDDAAVLAGAPAGQVLTCDMLVEGRHFRLDWSTPAQVGRKAVAQAVADVEAMGARPTVVVVALGCPPETEVEVLIGIAAGMRAECALFDGYVVGGDLVQGPSLHLAVTALGDLEGPAVTQAGAVPGHVVAVSGSTGWAAAGYAVLTAGPGAGGAAENLARPGWERDGGLNADYVERRALETHRTPRVAYGCGRLAAAAGAGAMTDTSDGLLADLGHIAAASGVLIDLQEPTIPEEFEELAAGLRARGAAADPRAWVLAGGEDHVLAATFPAARVPPGFTVIGVVADPGADGPGVAIGGSRVDAAAGGWTSFGRADSGATAGE